MPGMPIGRMPAETSRPVLIPANCSGGVGRPTCFHPRGGRAQTTACRTRSHNPAAKESSFALLFTGLYQAAIPSPRCGWQWRGRGGAERGVRPGVAWALPGRCTQRDKGHPAPHRRPSAGCCGRSRPTPPPRDLDVNIREPFKAFACHLPLHFHNPHHINGRNRRRRPQRG